MNAGKDSVRRIAANGTLSRDTVCFSCRYRASHPPRRHAATAAAAVEQPEPPQQVQSQVHPVTTAKPRKGYRLLASPVLSRPPLLTRELSSFEKAFYLYQKRLHERLSLPFTRYFYYKKATPGDEEWKRKIRARKTPARDIGVYDAYGKEGWNDEVLMDDKAGETDNTIESLILDAEGKNIVDAQKVGDADKDGEAVTGDARAGEGQRRELQKVEVEKPTSRITEADRKNDLRSLDRKMDRSLYLLVKNKEGQWRFPEDRIYGRENLHQAAERILVQSCGINMNTWIVGNHPLGYFHSKFDLARKDPNQMPPGIISKLAANHMVPTSSAARGGEEGASREEFGEKVFFMKGRIMAGQPDLSKNELGDTDFQWLVKEEVQEVVSPDYWNGVRNMLPER